MKKILFSPVGMTDPIPTVNYQDGSMLHIARVYQPDKIYLYMSKSVLENHQKDNRYLYCLDRLAELQNRKMEYEIIERPDLVKVQEYDYYFEDFIDIIKDIKANMEPEDQLLLNIASGTPAMKSALLVIDHLGEYDFTAIQVATPTKTSNEHIHEDIYPVEEIWEKNLDNLPDFENRCTEVVCKSLMKLKNEEIIKKFIASYDYHSAFVVAENIPEKSKGYIKLIEIAKDRSQFKFSEVKKGLEQVELNAQEKHGFMPQENSEIRKYFEYALLIDLKKKKKEYADFIRALSPLIMDLFDRILKEKCGVDLFSFTSNYNEMKKWDEKKLDQNEVGQRIKKALLEDKPDFRFDSIIKSEHYKTIIISELISQEKEQQKPEIITVVGALRAIEQKIRNLAAHEIIEVTEEKIKKETSYSSDAIMKFIKKAFTYGGMNIKKEDWDSYDLMNEIILKRMEEK